MTENNDQITNLFDKIFGETTRNRPISSYVISDAISGILTSIVTSRLQQVVQQPHQEQLECAASMLRKNYNNQVNIDDIAKAVFMSRYYFIRLFKEYFGSCFCSVIKSL